MSRENELYHQSQSIQQEPPSSFKPLNSPAFPVIILLTTLIAGVGGYLLGTGTSQSASQNTRKISFQPSPTTIGQTSIPIPSPSSTHIILEGRLANEPAASHSVSRDTRLDSNTDWIVYRNNEFKFQISYPKVGWNFSENRFDPDNEESVISLKSTIDAPIGSGAVMHILPRGGLGHGAPNSWTDSDININGHLAHRRDYDVGHSHRHAVIRFPNWSANNRIELTTLGSDRGDAAEQMRELEKISSTFSVL